MDGKADDCTIDGNGELVMLESQRDDAAEIAQAFEEDRVLAIVTMEPTGMLAVRLFDEPTQSLVVVLQMAAQGLLLSLKKS